MLDAFDSKSKYHGRSISTFFNLITHNALTMPIHKVLKGLKKTHRATGKWQSSKISKLFFTEDKCTASDTTRKTILT